MCRFQASIACCFSLTCPVYELAHSANKLLHSVWNWFENCGLQCLYRIMISIVVLWVNCSFYFISNKRKIKRTLSLPKVTFAVKSPHHSRNPGIVVEMSNRMSKLLSGCIWRSVLEILVNKSVANCRHKINIRKNTSEKGIGMSWLITNTVLSRQILWSFSVYRVSPEKLIDGGILQCRF